MTLSLDVEGRLSAALGRVASALELEQQERRRRANAIVYVDAPALQVAGTALPRIVLDGPNPGWTWFVQLIAVTGLAANDVLTVYRGRSLADVQPQNARFTFTVAAANETATWHPGGKGFALKGADTSNLILAGTVAGTVTLGWDIIQVADPYLFDYLS